MTHTTSVTLAPADVLARAKEFFLTRVPNNSAFVEREGPGFVILRGQGGEELVLRASAGEGNRTQVRASTLFFDQALDRFLSTLPLVGAVEVV